MEEDGGVENSRKNVGIVDVNGDKKKIFDSIIVKSDLEINYLFTDDERKTIDPEIKVIIDGKEVMNYYITKQHNSTTLAFIFEKNLKNKK